MILKVIKMEYITRINWKRKNKEYYSIHIYYKTETGFNKQMVLNYPASQYIKPHSRLGQLLNIKDTVKLSLFYIKKILVHSNYEL